MTFVAQPYEQFADDLLTALTGGIIHEEHRFVGQEETYSLSTPGAIPFSIKVIGQRNESFQLFELGIDYDYEEESEAIKWKIAGRLPDDYSYFYINFYPREGQQTLTDRNPGSVVTTLCEVFAREFAVLHKQMEMIYKSAFLDLAEGASLDHIAALLGLARKDAKFASGEVLFKRSTPAPADIAIPAGTLVSTEQGLNFETTEKRTLRRGQLSIVAPVRAQIEGAVGKVNASMISIFNRPIFGIENVVNESATFFAIEKETDEELQRRVKGTLERAGKSTLDAIKYSLVEDIPEITETNIQVVEKLDVPGLVEVRLGLESTGGADLVRRIEESIFYARPAGVRVIHNLPTRTQSENAQNAGKAIFREQAVMDFKAKKEPPNAIMIPDVLLAKMPQGVLSLRVEVLLRLAESNLTASQKENIEDQVRSTIMKYIEDLPMGEPLIYNKLLGRIAQPDSIADAVLLIGAHSDGEFQSYKGNLLTSERKATIDLYQIFVGLLEEIVFVDVLIHFQPKPGSSSISTEVSEEMKRAVKDVINSKIMVDAGKLLKKNIKSAIHTMIEASDLQFIEGNAVIVNVEFEETGRLLNDAEEIVLEEHEQLVLRNVDLKIIGKLDV